MLNERHNDESIPCLTPWNGSTWCVLSRVIITATLCSLPWGSDGYVNESVGNVKRRVFECDTNCIRYVVISCRHIVMAQPGNAVIE